MSTSVSLLITLLTTLGFRNRAMSISVILLGTMYVSLHLHLVGCSLKKPLYHHRHYTWIKSKEAPLPKPVAADVEAQSPVLDMSSNMKGNKEPPSWGVGEKTSKY